jgi:hypothetical protein
VDHLLHSGGDVRLAAASQVPTARQFGYDLAVRQTTGVKLLGQRDGVWPRLPQFKLGRSALDDGKTNPRPRLS